MVMTSDETRIQIFANWPMSHANRVARDNRKSPEYHVVAAIRKLRTDTNCPAGQCSPLSALLSVDSAFIIKGDQFRRNILESYRRLSTGVWRLSENLSKVLGNHFSSVNC